MRWYVYLSRTPTVIGILKFRRSYLIIIGNTKLSNVVVMMMVPFLWTDKKSDIPHAVQDSFVF